LKMEVTLSAIRHRIIQPLIWKIAQKIGKPYRSCSESELKSISRTLVLPDSKVFR
jgi:hypothetical protein